MSVRDAFREQGRICAAMGSPFTGRVCTLAAERLVAGGAVADRLLGWQGDAGGRGDALALRLAGALHGLVLEGRDPGLMAVYPPEEADDEALWGAIAAALEAHEGYILRRLDGPPQTNEPQRSAALCPGFLTIADRTGLPLVTSELGASAGLNLAWDHFGYRFGTAVWGDQGSPVRIVPDWQGPLPPLAAARVVERAGCDRDPVDAMDAAGRRRLLSFVWADQAERKARMTAAIAIARICGVRVERADAIDWLEARLAVRRPGCAHVVYHSIIWSYLPPEARARARAALEAAGAAASAEAPLAWLRMEGDGAEPGAALTLTLWPGGETRTLARADFHGAWVRWTGWT